MNDIPWAHMDIARVETTENTILGPRMPTGLGVRLILDNIENLQSLYFHLSDVAIHKMWELFLVYNL